MVFVYSSTHIINNLFSIISMMSSSHSVTVSSLWFLLIIMTSLGLAFCCIQSERDALLKFKHHLTNPSNRLADWVADRDCCRWTGVVCHNTTAHVIELHLRTLSIEEYFARDPFADYDAYEEYRKKSALGGKVSSCLLNLKQLSYLDLSYNDFGGFSIPRFLGSMQSLRYLNLSLAGFGGTIPSQLGNLSNLHYLNLRGSYGNLMHVENLDWISGLSSLEFLDLSYSNLSKSFDWLKVMNSLPSLVELHLSRCYLPSFYPLLNLNFSSLSILDLSHNYFEGPIPNVLQNMTSFLRELDLSWNYFNSSLPNWLYGLSHLQLLNLRYNYLQGQISNAIGNLTSLISLDLSGNYKLEVEFPKSFGSLCTLRSLNLDDVKLSQQINVVLEILSSGCVSDGLESLEMGHPELFGHLGDELGHFQNLKSFSLSSDTTINGPIPRSLKHLCKLRLLDLYGLKLSQEINDVLEILSSGCIANGLQSLSMMDCQLSGHLTNNISFMKNLIMLDLSYNLISGPIPLSLGEMTSLRYLYLSNNKLNGTLPVSLGQLKKLESIDISDNLLEGEVSEIHFRNLPRLYAFEASRMGKNVSLKVSPNWIPPLQLSTLALGSWHIGPQFPVWLHSLKKLSYLDLSNSSISSPIPIWFWDLLSSPYSFSNLSHNQMHKLSPNIPSLNTYLAIDLSSNNFSGPIPYFSSNFTLLDLSNNSFSGSILNFLCHNMDETKEMEVLNLERNHLSGEIPDCWMSWPYLEVLKLSNNNFSGKVPNSIGNLSSLESLHLHANNLSGVIPLSLSNCTDLMTLDFGENKLVGSIPEWIGERISSLFILNLRANKLDGLIPKELCRLASLHILDLADNSFSGTIPRCFNNFTDMAVTNDSQGRFYFYINGSNPNVLESTSIVMKGRIMEYSTTLRYVRSIDLSCNKLTGEIPKEITSLAGLQSLNLSQNNLTGRIPNGIGVMRWLEAMDFSQNQLSGNIPESISNLTFLSQLNLSYNKLSGIIPSGTQIQGFDPSSFTGNQLCGRPLTKNCSEEWSDVPSIDNGKRRQDDNGVEVNWFYVSTALGFVVGFWSVVGSLIFIKKWRYFYFCLVNNLGEKIWWSFLYKFF